MKYVLLAAFLISAAYYKPDSVSEYLAHLVERFSDLYQTQAKANRTTLKERIQEEVYLLQEKDKRRIFDCSANNAISHPQPFRPEKLLAFFSSELDGPEINGILQLNKEWPILVSMHHASFYQGESSRVFVALRGLKWGAHKTSMTESMLKFMRNYKNDLLVIPDSYLYLDAKKSIRESRLMTVCHARRYPTVGWIDQYWPGFHNSGSWELVQRLFPHNKNIFLIGWSNGSFPRSQFIETREIDKDGTLKQHLATQDYENIRKLKKFARVYSRAHEFVSEEIYRIRAILDIETNYSSEKPLWNLVKYIREYVRRNPDRLYYGSSNIYVPTMKNYMKLIRIFNLKGRQLQNGVVRYQNQNKNIIIDIFPLPRKPHFVHKYGNLLKTSFRKNKKVRRYLVRDHKKIVDYSLKNLHQFIRDKEWL